jgi:hypothetical protein
MVNVMRAKFSQFDIGWMDNWEDCCMVCSRLTMSSAVICPSSAFCRRVLRLWKAETTNFMPMHTSKAVNTAVRRDASHFHLFVPQQYLAQAVNLTHTAKQGPTNTLGPHSYASQALPLTTCSSGDGVFVSPKKGPSQTKESHPHKVAHRVELFPHPKNSTFFSLQSHTVASNRACISPTVLFPLCMVLVRVVLR